MPLFSGKGEEENFSLESFLEKNKLSVSLGMVGFFLLGLGVLSALVLSAKKEQSSIEIIPAEEEDLAVIYVHVAGAVEKPGLYQLDSGARVNDALALAGGLAAAADRDRFSQSVNSAQKLTDGVKFYIPFEGEAVGQKGEVAGEKTSFFSQGQAGRININTASVSQLDSLPGIGPAYAQRIVDYRESHGPFSKVEDLTQISGIGDQTLEKIKNQVTVF